MQTSSSELATTSLTGTAGIVAVSSALSTGGREIETSIRDFVARELLFSDRGFPHGNDVSFLEEGVIDSLGILELVTFTGRVFGVDVEPADVVPENFDSVARLAAYVRRKRFLPTETP